MVVCSSIISNLIDILRKMSSIIMLEMRNWLFLHELAPDIKYFHYKTLQKEVSWTFVGQLILIL